MSTKSSVRYGTVLTADGEREVHLYREAGGSSHVYLELTDVPVMLYSNWTGGAWDPTNPGHSTVVVAIPVEIWEGIRDARVIEPTYADYDDDQLRAMVEAEVDERIARWEERGRDGLWPLAGAIPYGLASDPREQQIEAGLPYWRRVREQHQRVRDAMAQLHHRGERARGHGKRAGEEVAGADQ